MKKKKDSELEGVEDRYRRRRLFFFISHACVLDAIERAFSKRVYDIPERSKERKAMLSLKETAHERRRERKMKKKRKKREGEEETRSLAFFFLLFFPGEQEVEVGRTK